MKFFSIEELSRSETAARRGIDNTPSAQAEANLEALAGNVLDPLRQAWGKAIRVNSGYRCEEVNRFVGGVKTSQHLSGEAADITAGNAVDNRRLYQLAIDLGLPFDQLIGAKYDFKWLHISHRNGGVQRRQVM